MIRHVEQARMFITNYIECDTGFLNSILKNLDPSLFQNITLGVLAIFIPFAIVFLTDVLNSKKEKRSEFEKMVLSDEVFGTKKVFWLAIISVIFFAFFSGTDTSNLRKILSIFAALILIFLFWIPFKKIIRFSEGYKPEFEIPFLKKLNFSRVFKFKNNGKSEKMLRAWNSFWSEKSEFNELDFIKIFISHIENAIKYKKFEPTIQLSQTYVSNIDKRNGFSISYEVLPKVFEWNEMLWNEEQLWLKYYDKEKRIQNFLSKKYFPSFFKSWVIKTYKKTNSERDNFWNWHYFGGDFFQAIIKELILKGGNRPYQLFSSFEKHVKESENKLDKIADKEEKERYWHYITGLFATFCPTFFDEINNSPSNYQIWRHDFPADWKISVTNIDKRISRVILHEFIQWSRNRLLVQNNTERDQNLSEVINGIFSNVHPTLFRAFLMLFERVEIADALEEEPNFYILGTSVSWSGSVDESEEDRDKRIAKMMDEKEASQKDETIRIILSFFHFWRPLIIYKNDLTDEESKNWESFTKEQRQVIVKRVRKKKLEEMQQEIESDEIKQICTNSELKETYRKDFLELTKLLLREINK